MQMKRKLCGLFRTTPEISNTDLQQTRIVNFVENEKHAKWTCTFSAINQSASNSNFTIPYCCALSTNSLCKISDLSHERLIKYIHSKKRILSFASQYVVRKW